MKLLSPCCCRCSPAVDGGSVILLESFADFSAAVGFRDDDGFSAVAESLLMFFSAAASSFAHLTLQKIRIGFLGPDTVVRREHFGGVCSP